MRRTKVDSLGTTTYYYDGDDIIVESDGAGSFPVGYTYGALGLITEFTHPSQWEWYSFWHHGDFIGSTRVLTGYGGQILTSYAYDAYGIPVDEGAPYESFTPFRYVGQLGYYKDRDHRMMLLDGDRGTGYVILRAFGLRTPTLAVGRPGKPAPESQIPTADLANNR